MNSASIVRRQITFKDLDAAVCECKRLSDLGYRKMGNWSLGQICRHLRLNLEASLDGYPKWMSLFAPLRPIMRKFLLPRLLRGDSPTGIRTASIYVPPDNLDDQSELSAYIESAQRFQTYTGNFYAHPGFGLLDRQLLEHFHAAHAAHHLSFLVPDDEADD